MQIEKNEYQSIYTELCYQFQWYFIWIETRLKLYIYGLSSTRAMTINPRAMHIQCQIKQNKTELDK